MNSYLDGSLLVGIVKYIYRIYSLSNTAKAVKIIKSMFTNSFTNKCIVMYLERKPTAEFTLSYRCLRAVGRKLDTVVGRIHLLFTKYLSSSFTFAAYDSFKKESSKNLPNIIISFSLPLLVGYGIFTTMLGRWNFSEGIKLLVIIMFILATVLSIDKWNYWFKNSVLYRLCQFIWE